VIGGFGPALAAALTIHLRRESLSDWARAIIRWRVSPWAYLYALGLPVLLAAGLNAALMVLGHQVEWGLAPERAPAYLLTFLLTAVIFGGQEEPGCGATHLVSCSDGVRRWSLGCCWVSAGAFGTFPCTGRPASWCP
jgi:hypothetical protein